MKHIVFILLLVFSVTTRAQTFAWRNNGYFNHSKGGTYENIDGSGIDLNVSGLVNDEAVGGYIKTGKNDQLPGGQTHQYTFTFSENVDVQFTIKDINQDTTTACFIDQFSLSGNPYITESHNVEIFADSIVKPTNPPFNDYRGAVTVVYRNVKSFTIDHGLGAVCNPGFIMISPLVFRKVEIEEVFGADTVHYNNIQFDFDEKSIDETYHSPLNQLIDMMQKDPDLTIVLLGYADDQGNNDYNLKLSKKRVNAVLGYLLLKGVDRSRIGVKYYGELRPIQSNESFWGRGMNRRVEIYTVK